ncbi:glycosyltransferase [uncultured Bacteroides sp.]|uniref:glycosyltransferase n=1 Tax=uncultured Bacteroides sp. TaxID=162156 RepID=UPI0027D946E6|nr:glycosyltransferase [uncultured Bacteroides sp.]
MSDIVLSIIVPCYNAEKYINRCLDSLINQDLKDYEVICVNDASTDNTLECLKEYSKKHSIVKVINHEKNKRQGGARNTGIRNAVGKYIGFVDIDDSIDYQMYSTLYAEATKFDLDVAECDYVNIDVNGKRLDHHIFCDNMHNFIDTDIRKRLIVCGGSVWCKIYKRDFLLKNNLFFPEGVFYEDNYFVPMVYAYMSSYSYIRQCYYNYYVNTSSTTNKKNTDNLYDRFFIAKKLISDFKTRGWDNKYREELDFLVILNAFSGTIFMCLSNYTYINYDLLNKSRNFILDYLPNFTSNKWYNYKYGVRSKFLLKLAKTNIRLFVVTYKSYNFIKSVIKKIIRKKS